MIGQGQRGFTLLEVLLSIGLLSMIAGMSLPLYASFQNRNDLDIATQSIADALRRAQAYARGVNNDSQWGVEIQSTGATVFKGAVFASRDATYDEETSIPASVTKTGTSEILFSKLSGAPNTTGTITLTSNQNDVRTITINAKGMVNY